MFAANPATLERMHTATFMTELADRKLREQWELEGSSTIHQRAMNKAFDILSMPNSAVLDPDVDARIRAQFEGMVAGDALLQEGWRRIDVGGNVTTRERRVNRRRKKT
jgi:trimethylamine--corrinoid protein Co-methyltransferase